MKEKLKKFQTLIYLYDEIREVFNKYCISDEKYIKKKFMKRIGYELDLKNVSTFNEKIQWLKLYDKNPRYTSLVDKYEVRKYISENIGEEYLIPLIGVFDTWDEIDFDKLPDQFVLKCTHDSGGVVICKDKNSFDKVSAKEKLCRNLRNNYFYYSREWPYKNVKPRIVCEQYMEDEDDGELKDYKFMCFNGEVKCSFVCLNRNSDAGLNVDFYDVNWKKMPFERYYRNSGDVVKKPQNYNQMIQLAQKLSENIPFVRVDFYEINGKVYFGELTFYPGSGFEEFRPVKYDYLLGSWIELPQK